MMGLNLGKLVKGAIGLIPGVGGIASAALGVVSGAKQQNAANKQNKAMLDMTLQRNKETAPLRSRALQMATQGFRPGREDLSSIFADSGNPYARVAPRPVAQPPVPQGPPPGPATLPRPQGPFGFLRARGAGPLPGVGPLPGGGPNPQSLLGRAVQ
jgi:hypothetical protein